MTARQIALFSLEGLRSLIFSRHFERDFEASGSVKRRKKILLCLWKPELAREQEVAFLPATLQLLFVARVRLSSQLIRVLTMRKQAGRRRCCCVRPQVSQL